MSQASTLYIIPDHAFALERGNGMVKSALADQKPR
jgi:hypothetical protein